MNSFTLRGRLRNIKSIEDFDFLYQELLESDEDVISMRKLIDDKKEEFINNIPKKEQELKDYKQNLLKLELPDFNITKENKQEKLEESKKFFSSIEEIYRDRKEYKEVIEKFQKDFNEKFPFKDWEFDNSNGTKEYSYYINELLCISVYDNGSGISLYEIDNNSLSCIGNYLDCQETYSNIDSLSKG